VSSWRTALHEEVPLARMLALAYHASLVLPRRAVAHRFAPRRGGDDVDRALDRLADTGKRVQFIFSGNEPLYEELELEGRLNMLDRWPNVGFDFIPGQDHTLRAPESQRCANEALDRALNDELQRVAEISLARV
jgi:hypothetical protein